MAVDKLVDSTQLDADLTSVANAIRTKGSTSTQLAFPSGFVSAINAISTGGGAVIEPLSVTVNGTYTAPSGVDGYSPVTVAVPQPWGETIVVTDTTDVSGGIIRSIDGRVYNAETWTFTLDDDTTVTKQVDVYDD